MKNHNYYYFLLVIVNQGKAHAILLCNVNNTMCAVIALLHGLTVHALQSNWLIVHVLSSHVFGSLFTISSYMLIVHVLSFNMLIVHVVSSQAFDSSCTVITWV